MRLGLDPRIERVQPLDWRVYGSGNTPQAGCLNELVEMAQLHEEMARERLDQGDGRGWIDWYAAPTALGAAGRIEEARSLISEGRQRADGFVTSKPIIDRELSEFEKWLRAKPVDGRPGPPRPKSATPTKV